MSLFLVVGIVGFAAALGLIGGGLRRMDDIWHRRRESSRPRMIAGVILLVASVFAFLYAPELWR